MVMVGTMSAPSIRSVVRIVQAHSQHEGAGFTVRRPIPSVGLEQVDPFLLVDELGPVVYAAGEATGAPDHPHRGFETVTYVLEGESEHEDSAGHRGLLGPGDVQWMTAGAGIVHSEMPSKRLQNAGGRMHGFQVWVNLPARDKMMKPRYQEVKSASIPRASSADGKATVRVIAGEALGVSAVIETRTPIVYHHWSLAPGASVQQSVPTQFTVFAYVFSGELTIAGRVVRDGQMAVLGPGEVVEMGTQQQAELLLLGGVPLNEPMARYGPFVMNSQAELAQAFRDFQTGVMGAIAR
jgi:redox-sensitive bicupin YhaK (pirin superfamily)